MMNTEFILNVLDHIGRLNAPPSLDNDFRAMLSLVRPQPVRPEVAVEIIQMVASRYRCDITQSLPRHDPAELSRQVAIILIHFGRIHTQHCPHCDIAHGIEAAFYRFANTFGVRHAFDSIPLDFPIRERLFFLPEGDSFTGLSENHKPLDSEQIRQNVRNWDVTGGGTR